MTTAQSMAIVARKRAAAAAPVVYLKDADGNFVLDADGNKIIVNP